MKVNNLISVLSLITKIYKDPDVIVEIQEKKDGKTVIRNAKIKDLVSPAVTKENDKPVLKIICTIE